MKSRDLSRSTCGLSLKLPKVRGNSDHGASHGSSQLFLRLLLQVTQQQPSVKELIAWPASLHDWALDGDQQLLHLAILSGR